MKKQFFLILTCVSVCAMEKPLHNQQATVALVRKITRCVKYAGLPSHARMLRADTLLAPQIAALLYMKADPNAKSNKASYYLPQEKKRTNRSILRIATELDLPKIMKLLLNAGADPDDIDQHGLKPILYYARECHVPLLLSYGADPDKGHHYIWSSLPASHSDNFNQLLLNIGADPNSRYSCESDRFDGYTFLMLAAYYANNVYPGAPAKRIKRFEIFLNAGADRTMKNLRGQTAADIAREKGYHDIADLLSKPRKLL